MDSDGYPDQDDFNALSQLDSMSENSSFALLEGLFKSCGSGYAKQHQEPSEYPPNHTPIDALEISTGGWSGCEAMMDYIQVNCTIFWMQYWYSETRGGHYVFKGRG